MFSDLSYCNCRVCGKRLDYFSLGAVFRYDWDQVGWAYCKEHIPQNSIAIDHCELVSLSYDDNSPAFKIDVDAVLTDGSVIPYTCDLEDIPGVKAVLEQVQGTVGKIVNLTGTNWQFDPDTGEITVDGAADIRNFTPSPIANTKLEKVLKDTTLVPKIRKTVKVNTINGSGTPTFDMDAGTMEMKVVADTNYPDSTVPTSKSRTFNLDITKALRQVKVDYVKQDGNLEYNKDTTTLKIPIKADTDWPGDATSKKVYLEFDIHEYFPDPEDDAKVAYIKKNGTETFDETTNVLSIPLKADTNKPGTATSLTSTLTIDLTATIAAAMKKVKVDYIQKNGDSTYNAATKSYTIPVKADTDHPGSGTSKTGTITQDVSEALKTVKVDYIQKNGDTSYNAATGDLTIPAKADTDNPGSATSKTANLTVNITDQLKTVKVDYVKQNGNTSYNPSTAALTIPVKADTDHPGTGTSKESNLVVDITNQLKTVKVDSSTIVTDPTKIALKAGSTKVIVVPVDADTDHPGSGTKGTNKLEIDISKWQGGGDEYPKVDYVKYYAKKTEGHKDPETGDQLPQLADEATNFNAKLLGSSSNPQPYYVSKIYSIGYDSDTTKPKTGVTDKKDALKDVPISLPIAKASTAHMRGQGWGKDPNDLDRTSACERHQNDTNSPSPIDVAVLGTVLEDYAMKAMLVNTELEADVLPPYRFDLDNGYPDVKADTYHYAGIKGLSKHTSYACTGTSKHVQMKNNRVPVNVIDNNYWDMMWKMASGGLTVSTSTFIILDPIDPNNPHDVYISEEAADLYLSKMSAKTRFAAGPYFDPAVNIKNMHDNRDEVANAAVVSIRINALADDKVVVNKLCPGDSTVAACPAFDEIYLDGGLYEFHTNADSVNTSVCKFTGLGWSSSARVGICRPWNPIMKIHMSVYAKNAYGLKCASCSAQEIWFFSFYQAGSRNAPTYPALWLNKKTGY